MWSHVDRYQEVIHLYCLDSVCKSVPVFGKRALTTFWSPQPYVRFVLEAWTKPWTCASCIPQFDQVVSVRLHYLFIRELWISHAFPSWPPSKNPEHAIRFDTHILHYPRNSRVQRILTGSFLRSYFLITRVSNLRMHKLQPYTNFNPNPLTRRLDVFWDLNRSKNLMILPPGVFSLNFYFWPPPSAIHQFHTLKSAIRSWTTLCRGSKSPELLLHLAGVSGV